MKTIIIVLLFFALLIGLKEIDSDIGLRNIKKVRVIRPGQIWITEQENPFLKPDTFYICGIKKNYILYCQLAFKGRKDIELFQHSSEIKYFPGDILLKFGE